MAKTEILVRLLCVVMVAVCVVIHELLNQASLPSFNGKAKVQYRPNVIQGISGHLRCMSTLQVLLERRVSGANKATAVLI